VIEPPARYYSWADAGLVAGGHLGHRVQHAAPVGAGPGQADTAGRNTGDGEMCQWENCPHVPQAGLDYRRCQDLPGPRIGDKTGGN